MRFLKVLGLVSLLVVFLVHSGSARAAEFFVRGDTDRSGSIQLPDAVSILNFIFFSLDRINCKDAADVNDDGRINIADPLYALNFTFLGGPQPPAPYPDFGVDPTDDALDCQPCALADVPCHLTRDVYLDSDIAFRNGTPSIAVDATGRPHVLFPSGTEGRYATTAPDGRLDVSVVIDQATDQPASFFWADVEVDPASARPVGLFSKGPGLEFWRWVTANKWERVDTLETFDPGTRNTLDVDPGGQFHAAVSLDDGVNPRQPGVAMSGEKWSFSPVGDAVWVEGLTLGLSPSSEPFVSFWESDASGDWLLRLGSPAGGVETVASLGTGALELNRNISFLVTESVPDLRAHFLFNNFRTSGGDGISSDPHYSLQYVRRNAESGWNAFTVAADDPFFESPDFCFEAPPFDGATCSVDYVTHHSLAMLRTGTGEVVYLFSRVLTVGELVARCPEQDPQSCSVERNLQVDGEIHVGWIENGEARDEVLIGGVATRQADAVLDANGLLHIVCYDESEGFTTVRYFVFGTPE